MATSRKDELKQSVNSIIDDLEANVDFQDMPEVQLQAEINRSRRELREKAERAAAEELGFTIDGQFNTKKITEMVNKQIEESGLKFRDVLSRQATKQDMKKFAIKKVNEVMPTNLKFRSLNRQDLNYGVKRFLKVRLKQIAIDRAAELTLEDDPKILAMIEAYNDGRGVPTGDDDDPTNASRQAAFRANHSYFWSPK
jgi:hypothetical protein